MYYQFLIAGRYLYTRRNRKILSFVNIVAVIGISIGVWSLVSVLAFQTGMEQELKTKILEGTSHLNIIEKNKIPSKNIENLVSKIRQLPGVKNAVPTSYKTALISCSTHSTLGILKAVDLSASQDSVELYKTILPGGQIHHLLRTTYEDGTEVEGIILGKNLAEDLVVKVGDFVQVTIHSDKGQLTPVGILPNLFTFKVVGLFQSGLYDYDSSWAYIAMETAEKINSDGEIPKVIQVNLENFYKVKEMRKSISDLVGSDYLISDWQELNKSTFAALSLQRLGFSIGVSLIIIVASFSVITTLMTLVFEKRKDIAILASIGVTPFSILVIFIIQGIFIGILGSLIGITIGIITSLVCDHYHVFSLDPVIYSISYVPFQLVWHDIFLVFCVTFCISLVSTLYPAWSASKLDPLSIINSSG